VLGLLLTSFVAACSGSDGGDQFGAASGELGAAGIVSDDFHTGVLDTQLWNIVDPQGDGTVELVGAGTPDAQLRLSVPAGTTHDAWTSNTTLRAMQPATNDDLEVEVKFESEPTQQYQGQGLLVEQDPSNYVRFDVYSDGNSLRVFGATFSNGSATIRVNSSIASGPTTYLRMARSGNQWTAQYSYDGSSWSTAASFSHALTVSSVGVFAANFNPNPAYTAVVDYFYETSAPIASEDPPLCDPADALVLTTQATNGVIVRNPDQSSYSCGDVVTLTAQPNVGATFLGWGGALSGTANPEVLTINADTTVTASFDLDTTAPLVSNVNVTASQTSAVVSWQTNELSVGTVEYGLTTAYGLGPVSSSTLSTAHAVTLPGLIEGQVYHYRITTADSLNNSATGADATFTTTSGVCVLTTQATNGVIVRNPDQSSYSCGDAVTLTAQPNVGATFVGWGGALSGTANPEVLTLNANTTVVANFALDTTPPQISNVNVSAGETSATVNWQTDDPRAPFRRHTR
jgi:regulation of enolase protein 1 (concanavalin A-like superfamily)